jgi:hypothetical protein
MGAKNLLKIVILMLVFSTAFSQEKRDNIIKNTKSDVITSDYKILASTSAYIEFEFTPTYSGDISFQNAYYNSSNYGKPDLGCRTFSFILPGDKNNRVEILDSRYSEKGNIDVKPVPKPKKSSNKLEFLYDYTPDNKIYSANSFFPSNNIILTEDNVRDKYLGRVQVYPVSYNPVTKTIRKYSYIKVRVTYGDRPIIGQKQLSRQEIAFFNDIALNSKQASGWIRQDIRNQKNQLVNSVLASGDFYKIEVKEDGIYKIDKNFLSNAGINVNNIDPRTIKMYGNGGKELPYDNLEPVYDDLTELKIFVEGENDGHFDDNDYILFYGNSPNWWSYNPVTRKEKHNINHYSTVNYYFITFGGSNGRRMPVTNSINNGNLTPIPFFKDRLFDEPEINNLGSTGLLWLSQRISIGERFLFNKSLDGYVSGSLINYKLRLENASPNAGYIEMKDGNSYYKLEPFNANYGGGFIHVNYTDISDQYSLNSGSTMNLQAFLNPQYNSGSIDAYYDYLEVFYDRSFNSAVNNSLFFRSPDTSSAVEYQVSTYNTSDVKIFDVSSFNSVSLINPISYSSGVVRFQDFISGGTPKSYYCIGGNNFKSPISISSKIANQNLHGGYSEGADFIIISPPEFLSAANRLKSYREAPGENHPEYLKTFVINVNEIYNEFGGGLPDPVSMRNFIKFAYGNWTRRPVYILFFGDGSYDYKNIYNLSVRNFLPPIEKNSDYNDELSSYPSDDFICEINSSTPEPYWYMPDFFTGRLNINYVTEANAAIDKIIRYESKENFGIWKKKIMYVADDGWTTDQNQGEEKNIHTQQCEDVAELHSNKDFEKEKIYIVTYPTVITPQGRRKPGANVDIIKGWNEGRLVINYVGHGSTDLWAHEHVFVRDETIPQLTNTYKLPLVTIASCDLLRWDDPFSICAGEQLVLIDKGAIGVVGANRPVFSPNNAVFNNALWESFMKDKDTLNLPIRIGKAMYTCKLNIPLSDNDMKYGYEGDPTVRISVPQYFTSVDSINHTYVGNSSSVDTIKALQKVEIKGRVLNPDSTFWSTYNGEITIKVFDVDKNIIFYDFGYPFFFRLDGGTIFKGKTNVVNGRWSIKFIVPRDISYTTGNGKLTAYFSDKFTEGSGFSDRFVLNGIDTNAIVDTMGPIIHSYVDSRNFRNGDIVNQNTKIIADLYDISGINLTGQIGHKLEAILNDNENSKIDLTSYYNSDTSYQYGSLEYPLQNLADGNYKLKIRAWDTYNNLSEGVINFTVKSTSQLYVDKVFNYPNPFKDNTSFTFQHNLDSPINIRIKVYTVSGRLIKEITRTNIAEKNVIVDWDGRDNDGDAIANGTYIYKVTIKSDNGIYNKTSTGIIAKLK